MLLGSSSPAPLHALQAWFAHLPWLTLVPHVEVAAHVVRLTEQRTRDRHVIVAIECPSHTERLAALEQGADVALMGATTRREIELIADVWMRPRPSFAHLASQHLRLPEADEARPVQHPLPFEIDVKAPALVRGALFVHLTTIEVRLISVLAESPGQLRPRSELCLVVLNIDFEPSTNRLDVHVHNINRKLERLGVPTAIVSQRGKGYQLGVPKKKPGR